MRTDNKKLAGARLVPIFVLCAVVAAILFIPFKVTGYGYLTRDDALRHSAKVISGKGWSNILVLRDDIKMDSHPGWHAILNSIHKLTGWDQEGLVVFSIIFLFVLFCFMPVSMFKRPEAWIMALLVITIASPWLLMRLFLGRPYIITMSVIIMLSVLWPKLNDKNPPYRIMLILTLLLAASTWIHCSWHLLALPILCFFLAREWRAGSRIMLCAVLGIAIGALLTGHPYIFLRQTLFHTIRAFNSHELQRMLVSEFQSFGGDRMMVVVVLGMIAWRKMRGAWNIKRIDNPVFILAMLGWALGFISKRFWMDWGMPAIAIWIAQEFQEVLKERMDSFSWFRLLLTIAVAGTFYIALTTDIYSRWTSNLTKEYLSLDNPEHKEWLPEPGGIIYSDDMNIFYDTFHKNPRAPWRYILGFEPTMMPSEDLAIFRKIQWNFGADKSFEPWVKKMKPEDRLIIRRGKGTPPDIPELEWHYAVTGIWVGRLAKK